MLICYYVQIFLRILFIFCSSYTASLRLNCISHCDIALLNTNIRNYCTTSQFLFSTQSDLTFLSLAFSQHGGVKLRLSYRNVLGDSKQLATLGLLTLRIAIEESLYMKSMWCSA